MGKGANNIEVISARKIYELLDSIHGRPEIWLTSKSITSLQDFLNGYLTLGVADEIYHEGQPSFKEFELWVIQKGQYRGGVGNIFSRVLLAECQGSEETAFEKFFVYLGEFMKENSK